MKRFEVVVGLLVNDDNMYNEYRKAMTPLLVEHKGGFRYDFKVSETLISETSNKINRVFTIYFGSQDLMKEFFNNEEYLKIRTEFFDKSVSDTTIISQYEID